MTGHRVPLFRTGIGVLAAVLAMPASTQDEPRARELDYEGPFRVSMGRVIDGWRYNLRWREGPSSRRDGRFNLSDVHTPSATSTDQDCERDVGIAVRDFVRGYLRGKRLRTRNVRRGREPRAWVGRLDADGEDLSSKLLEMGLAFPYNDSRWNPELRRWDCNRNEAAWQGLREAGTELPAPLD
ncbi:MAG: hypothetical protein PVG91_10830 [Gammaproteobacteria bacterium]|jgi:endonuclease YncB( thermonuclease family)